MRFGSDGVVRAVVVAIIGVSAFVVLHPATVTLFSTDRPVRFTESDGLHAVELTTATQRCGAPIIDSWHGTDRGPSGWFGYAPLSQGVIDFSSGNCRAEAESRMELGVAVLAVALGAVIVARLAGFLRPDAA